jgi:hypothetical protein
MHLAAILRHVIRKLRQVSIQLAQRSNADGAATVTHGFAVRQFGKALVAASHAPFSVPV